MKTVVLIPAFNPDNNLVLLVERLSSMDFSWIVVVNDGSTQESDLVFKKIGAIPKTTVLQHSINKGKGAALKLGLDHIYLNFPDALSVVTADADGQHALEDIDRLAQCSRNTPDAVILGARQFKKTVPFRSLIGNKFTNFVMRLFFRMDITDSQTGLRVIPRHLIPKLLTITYNGYEFEMEMLLLCRKAKIALIEIPVRAIYLEGNKTLHFNPLIDSVKIYLVLFRYFGVSLVSATLDFFVFIIAYRVFNSILMTTYISRSAALIVNYGLVRSVVFKSRKKFYRTFPKYLLLVCISGFISAALINYFVQFYHIHIIIAKIISESTLYLANFLIQKDLVFPAEEEA